MTELSIVLTLCSVVLVYSLMLIYRILLRIEGLIKYKFDDGFADKFEAIHKYISNTKDSELVIRKGRVKKVVFNRGY